MYGDHHVFGCSEGSWINQNCIHQINANFGNPCKMTLFTVNPRGSDTVFKITRTTSIYKANYNSVNVNNKTARSQPTTCSLSGRSTRTSHLIIHRCRAKYRANAIGVS